MKTALARFIAFTAISLLSSRFVNPLNIPARSSNRGGEADRKLIHRNVIPNGELQLKENHKNAPAKFHPTDDNIFYDIGFTEDFGSETVPANHSDFPKSTNATVLLRQRRVLPLIGAVIGGASLGVAIGNAVIPGRDRMIAIRNAQPWSVDVECRSGDDNLGWKRLGSDQGFAFQFSANIWGNTHFWCTAKSDGRYKAFPVYNQGAPNWRKIMYNIRNEGIFITDNFDSYGGAFHSPW